MGLELMVTSRILQTNPTIYSLTHVILVSLLGSKIITFWTWHNFLCFVGSKVNILLGFRAGKDKVLTPTVSVQKCLFVPIFIVVGCCRI